MAAKVAIRLPLTMTRVTTSLFVTGRRTLTTFQQPHKLTTSRAINKLSHSRLTLQHSFRRPYTDAPTVSPVTQRRGRGFFRWTWRLTYLSVLGGTGWLAYNIYLLRTPQEQLESDASKKTLVILGRWVVLMEFRDIIIDHPQALVGALCHF